VRRAAGQMAAACLMALAGAAGCQSRAHQAALSLGERMARIQVGQTGAAEVLELLGEKGRLETAETVSVYRQRGSVRELGLVRLAEADERVARTAYVQVRSTLSPAPLFSHEELGVRIEATAPAEVLGQPYENKGRQAVAVAQYCRDALLEDGKACENDQAAGQMVGMARSAFTEAFVQLDERVRDQGQLTEGKGFGFTHSVYGPTWLRLEERGEGRWVLRLRAASTVDPWGTW